MGLSSIVVALIALVVIGGVAHLAHLLISYRRGTLSKHRDGDASSTYEGEPIERLLSRGRDSSSSTDGGEVDPGRTVTKRCPMCNAVNDVNYEFCRECVADLSGR